jgi:hypothetical protein
LEDQYEKDKEGENFSFLFLATCLDFELYRWKKAYSQKELVYVSKMFIWKS